MVAPTRHIDMTTTMNQTTANATPQDYWTQTAQSVFPCDDEEYYAACDEVASLAMKWSEHRFGLCGECDCGIDDEADFVITGNANEDDTLMTCVDCWTNGGAAPQRRMERAGV